MSPATAESTNSLSLTIAFIIPEFSNSKYPSKVLATEESNFDNGSSFQLSPSIFPLALLALSLCLFISPLNASSSIDKCSSSNISWVKSIGNP